MVEDKDIIMVIVPGVLTLSALLLVVVGLLIREVTEELQIMARASAVRKEEFRWVAATTLGVGVLSLAVISGLIASALGMGWMLGLGALYVWTIVLFFTTIGSAVLTALALVAHTVLRPRTTDIPDPDR